MKKYQSFSFENFQFLEVNLSIYLNRRVFVMVGQAADVMTAECFPDTLYICV